VHQFVRKLITEWRRLELPVSGETVVIAVSGGADSVSLLLGVHDLVIRKKLALRVVAAHFNHKLRGAESDRDEEYVRSLCTKLDIELAVGHGSLLKEGNLEQNARDARYKFLSETAANLGAFVVLTAHTVNDQAETFLLNLVRGSGPDGLSGMKAVRKMREEEIGKSASLLVRPLLTWAKRKETEGICRDLGVEYCYDTMNEDTAFKRVRIRKILLPLLEDMNPNIVETLANTASLMQNLPAAVMVEQADELDLATVRDLGESELYSTLREWLRQKRGTTRALQLKHIKAIERLVLSEKSGRVAEMPGGARVVKSGGRLRYEENGVDN
jgi:tRNA(Ile)-lysidine synthase